MSLGEKLTGTSSKETQGKPGTWTRIRSYFKEEEFSSREFDLLAEKMNVPRPKKGFKYSCFKEKWPLARSDGNRIHFSKDSYLLMSDDQKLAVAAHEFAHIRERHDLIRMKTTLVPSLAGSLVICLLGFAINWAVAVSFFVLAFLLLYSTIYYLKNFEYLETEADSISAFYVDSIHLETALLMRKNSLEQARKSRAFRLRELLSPRNHPPEECRIEHLRSLRRVPVEK